MAYKQRSRIRVGIDMGLGAIVEICPHSIRPGPISVLSVMAVFLLTTKTMLTITRISIFI